MTAAVDTTGIEEKVRKMSPVAASADEREDFAALYRALKDVRAQPEPEFKLVGPNGQTIALPESGFHLLMRLVEVLAQGDAITLVPVHKELTSQQAADILNVSRQYLVRLLDQGDIPFTRAGTHRRIRFEDVVKFKQSRDRERLDSLDELTRLSQEYGGYNEFS